MILFNRLRFLREERKLTQEEVSKILGIDHTTVSKHETSSRSLSEDDIQAYAKLFKVNSHEIFISLDEEGR